MADRRKRTPKGPDRKEQEAERERARPGHDAGAATPWLLYVVVFVCGAVLMGLEMIGSRILAPNFGNSIFVWGSLISIFLAALTLGYYAGGVVADRWPRIRVMAAMVAAPGLMIFTLPFLYPTINRAIAQNSLGPRWDPLLASVILFLLPSVFLGTISPFAVRLAARAVARMGTTAGLLYAISTAGSIVGTIVTAFFLIGVAGVARIVHLLGLVLVLLAAGMLVTGRRRAVAAVLLGLAVAGAWLGLRGRSPADAGVLFETDSFYHHIKVSDEGDSRVMDFDNLRQSGMFKDDPALLKLIYSHYMSLAFAFRPDPTDAAVVGLGGGSLPKAYHKAFPNLRIDAVEIDPEVLRAAAAYFALQQDPRLQVHVQDGRLFFLKTDRRYDLVFLDAYNSDTVPFHLVTREFYREVKTRLKPDGVVAANLISGVVGDRSKLFRSIYKTLSESFAEVYVFPVRWFGDEIPAGVINVILVATDARPRLTSDEIARRAALLGTKILSPTELREKALHLLRDPVPVADVPVLTDDYAPVDQLINF
ncbi:MAG TPA: fused MFS/spermidine synthase [Candidatus Methylomirabilis sp.]|jgi:spermidine synthase